MGIPKSSRRTGGPKTAAGKERVALNAVTSGAYATHLILPGEDAEQFTRLESAFVDAFAPADVIEAALVHDLAALAWKKQRLATAEQALLGHRLQAPAAIEDRLKLKLGWPSHAEFAWPHLDTLNPQTIVDWYNQRAYVRQLRDAPITESAVEAFATQAPAFYQRLVELAGLLLGLPAPSISRIVNGYMKQNDGNAVPVINAVLDTLEQEAEAVLWAYPIKDELQRQRRALHAQRIVDWVQQAPMQRATDDVNRAFFRTLAELRQQQNWRCRRNAIDVTPSDTSSTAAPADAVVTAGPPTDAPNTPSAAAHDPMTPGDGASDIVDTDDGFHYDD